VGPAGKAPPRWSAAAAKSDPGDSYKLADYLRTDGHQLRRLDPEDRKGSEGIGEAGPSSLPGMDAGR
jgi:hypothetical protein